MPDYWERRQRVLARDLGRPGLREEQGETLQLASIVEESVVDGPGLRFVVFTQGCPHRCLGCHNPGTHLKAGGIAYSIDRVLALYDQNPLRRGITLSGGDPFEQAGAAADLARAIHQRGGDVITYTGYRLEQLQRKETSGIQALLSETDLLIDGPFVEAKRCLEVPFVGSLNQRLIALSERGNHLLTSIPATLIGADVERIACR